MSNKPEEVTAEAWGVGVKMAGEYVAWLNAWNSTGHLSEHAADALADSFARAMMAAVEAEREGVRDLVDCLEDMTNHYAEVRNDLFGMEAAEESEVIAARRMIAAIRSRTPS